MALAQVFQSFQQASPGDTLQVLVSCPSIPKSLFVFESQGALKVDPPGDGFRVKGQGAKGQHHFHTPAEITTEHAQIPNTIPAADFVAVSPTSPAKTATATTTTAATTTTTATAATAASPATNNQTVAHHAAGVGLEEVSVDAIEKRINHYLKTVVTGKIAVPNHLISSQIFGVVREAFGTDVQIFAVEQNANFRLFSGNFPVVRFLLNEVGDDFGVIPDGFIKPAVQFDGLTWFHAVGVNHWPVFKAGQCRHFALWPFHQVLRGQLLREEQQRKQQEKDGEPPEASFVHVDADVGAVGNRDVPMIIRSIVERVYVLVQRGQLVVAEVFANAFLAVKCIEISIAPMVDRLQCNSHKPGGFQGDEKSLSEHVP